MPPSTTEMLPADIPHACYDRQQLKPRIVHIGFGAFHRAHQAIYMHNLLNLQASDWGICEVGLFGKPTLIQALRQQDNQFTVLEKGASGQQAILVGCVCHSLHGQLDGLAAVMQQLADPQVAIISLTITEKGYCIEPQSGELDWSNPQIQQDATGNSLPCTAPGVLVEALRLRKQQGAGGVSILSCDNIPCNGHIIHKVIIALAEKRDTQLAQWIEQHVSFPSTMVDRIVPAITETTLNEITAIRGGSADPCAIACEPFKQWVIEDKFVAGRPDWDRVGAQFVDNVLPYEQMKLRMLNGSHSFLAYLGYLSGYQHIDECVNDHAFWQATRQLMLEEQAPTLHLPGTDLTAYANSLLERFANPALKHRTWQIAMDGSQKIPQRWLDSLCWHLQQGHLPNYLLLAIAGWMHYVGGIDEAGQPIEIKDPLLPQIQQIIQQHAPGAERVKALLAFAPIFGDKLVQNTPLLEKVTALYIQLQFQGVKKTLATLLAKPA
jgi:fructuronate reductase